MIEMLLDALLNDVVKAILILLVVLFIFKVVYWLSNSYRTKIATTNKVALPVAKSADMSSLSNGFRVAKDDITRIPCLERCDGHYYLINVNRSRFYVCSNFPKCTSGLTVSEYAAQLISKVGINIYTWHRECDGCGCITPVNTYYLLHQVSDMDVELEKYFSMIYDECCVGDVRKIDSYLASKNDYYVKMTDVGYGAYCKHCGTRHGRDYIAEDPDEIFEEFMHTGLTAIEHQTIPIADIPISTKELIYQFRILLKEEEYR